MNGLSLFNLFGLNSLGKTGNEALFQAEPQTKGDSLFNRIFGMVLGGVPGFLKKHPAAPQFPADLASWVQLSSNLSRGRAQDLGQLLTKAAYPSTKALQSDFSGPAPSALPEVVVLPSGQAVSSEQLTEKLLTGEGTAQILVVRSENTGSAKSAQEKETVYLALPILQQGGASTEQLTQDENVSEKAENPVLADALSQNLSSIQPEVTGVASGGIETDKNAAEKERNQFVSEEEAVLTGVSQTILQNGTMPQPIRESGDEKKAGSGKSNSDATAAPKTAPRLGWFRVVLKSGEPVLVAVPVGEKAAAGETNGAGKNLLSPANADWVQGADSNMLAEAVSFQSEPESAVQAVVQPGEGKGTEKPENGQSGKSLSTAGKTNSATLGSETSNLKSDQNTPTLLGTKASKLGENQNAIVSGNVEQGTAASQKEPVLFPSEANKPLGDRLPSRSPGANQELSAKQAGVEKNAAANLAEMAGAKIKGQEGKSFLLVPLQQSRLLEKRTVLPKSTADPSIRSGKDKSFGSLLSTAPSEGTTAAFQIVTNGESGGTIPGILVQIDSLQMENSGEKPLWVKKGQKGIPAVKIQEVAVAEAEPGQEHWLALEKMSQTLTARKAVLKEMPQEKGEKQKNEIPDSENVHSFGKESVGIQKPKQAEIEASKTGNLSGLVERSVPEKELEFVDSRRGKRETVTRKQPTFNGQISDEKTGEDSARENQIMATSGKMKFFQKTKTKSGGNGELKRDNLLSGKLPYPESSHSRQQQFSGTGQENGSETGRKLSGDADSSKKHFKKLSAKEEKPFSAGTARPFESSRSGDKLVNPQSSPVISEEPEGLAASPRPEHMATKISAEALQQSVRKSGKKNRENEKIHSASPEQKIDPPGHPANEKSAPIFERNRAAKPTAESPNSTHRSESFSQLTRATFDKLVRHTRLLVQNQGGQMHIQLKPNVLGGARILVEALQNQVSVKILVDKPETRHVLEQHVQALHAAVAQQSGRVQEIQISIHVQSDATSQQQTQSQGQNQRSGTSQQQDQQNKNFSSGYRRDANMTEEEKKMRRFGYNSMEMVA